MKGALLGAGNVAVHGHLPGWLARQDVEIVAAADPRPERRELVARLLPRLAWYDSAEELLARERVDFVDICAPPAMHAPLIAASLANGLHVLCEKPLVLSSEELSAVSDISRRRHRVLACVHNWRHAPILAAMTAIVKDGAVGEVLSCRWETLRDRPAGVAGEGADNWRLDPSVSGGGVLIDHGWHALYVVCGWLREPPSRVAARLTARRPLASPIEDTAEVALESPGGARAEIFLSWAASERRNHAAVEGTRGRIQLDGPVLERFAPGSSEPAWRREFPQSLADGSHHPDWFGGVAEEFLDEIARPERRGASLEQASLCLGLIALARESSRRGGKPRRFERRGTEEAPTRERSVTT